jgi:hypothetical protein
MVKLNKWNWGAFLLCPIWSIYHRFYLGCWGFFMPIILWGVLVPCAKSQVPPIAIISWIFLVISNLVYWILSIPFYSLTSHIFIEESPYIASPIGTYIASSIVPIGYYLGYSIYIGTIANRWLQSHKSSTELSIINRNAIIWKAIGILLFIPLVLTSNHLTIWLIQESIILMPIP